MPDLLILFGPPAAGKAAIGHELAARTGFRFFHNHLTTDPVAALFGWGGEAFGRVLEEVRWLLFTRAAAQADLPCIIFTFVWAFDLPGDRAFLERLTALFEEGGGRVFFVELVASLETRIEREGTPLRTSLKPAKQDVEGARALLRELDGKHVLNSPADVPLPALYLKIDTEAQPPGEAAMMIAQHFGFAC